MITYFTACWYTALWGAGGVAGKIPTSSINMLSQLVTKCPVFAMTSFTNVT